MEAFCHAAPFGHLLTTLQAGNGSAQGDLLQDTDLAREPVKEPAKRWFNWWRANEPLICIGARGTKLALRKGDEIEEGPFASKDIAESAAERAEHEKPSAVSYMGAYPEGERP